MNSPRPKLSVKAGAPARDPRRRSVRPGAPRPPGGPEVHPPPPAKAGGKPSSRPQDRQDWQAPGPKPGKQAGTASGRPPRPGPRDAASPPAKGHRAPAEGWPARPADAKGTRSSQNTTGPGGGPKPARPAGPRPARPEDARYAQGAPAKRPRPDDPKAARPAGTKPAARPAGAKPAGAKPAGRPADAKPPARSAPGTKAPSGAPSAHRAEPRPPARPSQPAPRPQPAAPAAPRADGDATQGIRLSKHLSDNGMASRREADEWIGAGWVRVDGVPAVLGQRILPGQQVEIDPAAREHQARRVTILLHKPVGYVSGQAEDGYEPASVLVTPGNQWQGDGSRIRFNPGHLRGLAPAGRLDIDSTGLLVLTQDGRVARLLIGDDSRIEKEYLVRVAPTAPDSVLDDALALLNHGLELDGKPLKPAKVSWQNEDQLRFVLREGKKRQIRRMCELVGFKVLGLKRVRIGSIVLGQLPQGQWRYLGDHEHFA